jgi:hypothetical protein
MNLLVLAGFALGVLAWLWLAQTVALIFESRRPIWRLPFRHGTDSRRVRGVLKLALGSGLLAVLLLYPWAIGQNPLQYHGEKFSFAHWGLSLQALLLVCGLLSALLAASVLIGWAKVERRHSPTRLAYKIIKAFLIPLPLTLIEEPLFRGLILEQLSQALPHNIVGMAMALVVSAAFFAAVHFLRPQKHSWLAAVGLFYVGFVLGLVYLLSGHHYLLPIAFHAGGVFYIQVTRPVTSYQGPAWLIGRPTYPIAGLLGLLAVTTAAGIISAQLVG